MVEKGCESDLIGGTCCWKAKTAGRKTGSMTSFQPRSATKDYCFGQKLWYHCPFDAVQIDIAPLKKIHRFGDTSRGTFRLNTVSWASTLIWLADFGC